MLAPIEDMTSNSFRTICYKYGADLTFTDMSRILSLSRKNRSTWDKIEIKNETPTVIQLIGNNEHGLKKFLSLFEPKNGFQGFNLNIGCPAPNFVDYGMGCAMIKRISKTRKILNIIRDNGYNASIKMRLGLTKAEKEKKVYLNLIDGVDADFFVVHARYGLQTYAEPADFNVYQDCVNLGKNIIANGDIKTKEQVKELKEIGLKGVMIGRAAITDPGIFNKLKGIQCPLKEQIIKEYLQLAEQFNEAFKYKKNILKHNDFSKKPNTIIQG